MAGDDTPEPIRRGEGVVALVQRRVLWDPVGLRVRCAKTRLELVAIPSPPIYGRAGCMHLVHRMERLELVGLQSVPHPWHSHRMTSMRVANPRDRIASISSNCEIHRELHLESEIHADRIASISSNCETDD